MALGNLVRKFVKPHGSGNSQGNVTVINVGGKKQDNYDNKNLDVNSIHATNANIDNLTVNNTLSGNNISADYIDVNNTKVKTMTAEGISTGTANISDLTAHDAHIAKVDVSDTATINNLIANYIQSKNIVTDDLTVNKTAHFFELIIDKINSVGGTIMNTATNCTLDYVDVLSNDYRCYWRSSNSDGQEIENQWFVNDQAICQSFNMANSSNKYYWRLVTNTDTVTGNPKHYVNLNPDYTHTGSLKPKISTTSIDYYIEFTDGFIYTDGVTDFTSFTVEPIGESQYSSGVLTIENVGDGVKVSASDYVIINGDFVFDLDTPAKLNITVVYEDGVVEYNPASGFSNQYHVLTETDKAVSYFLITSDTVEVWDECNWIDLSKTDKDGTSDPEAGDVVCQLGYRYGQNPTATERARASAIIIASYNTPDSGVTPPSYAQYQDITDYSLGNHRKTYFDATGGHVIGEFVVQAGNTAVPLDQYILSLQQNNPMRLLVHNSSDVDIELIALQTDGNQDIKDLNNWPEYMYVMVTNNGTPVTPDTLTMSLFGRPINLLNFTSDTVQSGIYVQAVQSLLPTYAMWEVRFNFAGQSQHINNSSLVFNGTYTTQQDTYNFSNNIPVVYLSSVKGTDAEVYQLYCDNEYAKVDSTAVYSRTLKYRILHTHGAQVEFYTPTNGDTLRIIEHKPNGVAYSTTTLSYQDWNNGWEYHPNDISSWYTDSQNKPLYITVELLNSSSGVLDERMINVSNDPTALFSVKQGLTTLIQANTDAITTANSYIGQLQTDYSALTQTVSGINSTVASHTSYINTINNEITSMNSYISTIDQKADYIGMYVGYSYTYTMNGSTLPGRLQRTGIDITNGTITLNAENTIVNGSLNIYDDNTGLCLYDTNKELKAQMVTKDITGINSPNFESRITYNWEMESNSCTLIYDLGQIQANQILSITEQDVYFTKGERALTANCDYTISILDSNDNVITSDSRQQYDIRGGALDITNLNIQTTDNYRLKLEITYGGSENLNTWTCAYKFLETVTSDSYLIIGRDGMLSSKPDNLIVRIDDNQTLFRSNDDGIKFDKIDPYYPSTIKRIGWKNGEQWVPFDSYERTIRLVDYGTTNLDYIDRELSQPSGNNLGTWTVNPLEASTIIFDCGHNTTVTMTNYFGLVLPSSSLSFIVPGFTFRVIDSAYRLSGNTLTSHHIHILCADSNDHAITGANTNITATPSINDYGVYYITWSGSVWIVTS